MQTDASAPKSAEPKSGPEGALLTEAQIRRLKIAIAVMTALLVVGIVTLIARVMYLASQRGDQAASTIARPVGAPGQPLLTDIRLPLPAGAAVKATSLTAGHLSAHYAGPTGEGVVIVDLVTGKVASHVRFEPQR